MSVELDLVTTTDAARAYGVSRQAVEQALARSLTPPRVVALAGRWRSRMFHRAEFHEWWMNRTVDAWVENRPPSHGPAKQINIRVPLTDVERLLTLRKPNQALANLAAQIFTLGLETALKDSTKAQVARG
jgi:hypothetical protein